MCSLSLSFAFNSMAMLPAARKVGEKLRPSAVTVSTAARSSQALTPVQQVATVRAYSTGKPQGGWLFRLQSGANYYWNRLMSLFSRPRSTRATDLSVSQKLAQRIKPAVEYVKPTVQSVVQAVGSTSVAQQGAQWISASLREIAEDEALPLIAELRNKFDIVGKVDFGTEYDGKLTARGDWWKVIFDICEKLTGHKTISRNFTYQKSDKITEALNQKFEDGRTLLGNFFTNLIDTVQSSAAEIVANHESGRHIIGQLQHVGRLDGLGSVLAEVGSLVKLGAELNEADIAVIKDQFAQWINKIQSSNDARVYDVVMLCSLISMFDWEGYLANIFNQSGQLGKRMYSFTSSDGTVYKINEEMLRDVLGAGLYDLLPKKVSDIGHYRAGEVIHGENRERKLKSAIGGLFQESSAKEATPVRELERVRYL